jgi:hypothetical protein
MLNDPATFITHDVLRLPAKGLVPRYTKIVLAFFISGVGHTLVDKVCHGLTFAESQSIRFFTTQALGIMVEDAVQEIWRRCFGSGKSDSSKGTATWKRVVGFVWLWAFMAWTMPSWVWVPISKRTAGEDTPIMGRLSIARWLLDRS